MSYICKINRLGEIIEASITPTSSIFGKLEPTRFEILHCGYHLVTNYRPNSINYINQVIESGFISFNCTQPSDILEPESTIDLKLSDYFVTDDTSGILHIVITEHLLNKLSHYRSSDIKTHTLLLYHNQSNYYNKPSTTEAEEYLFKDGGVELLYKELLKHYK